MRPTAYVLSAGQDLAGADHDVNASRQSTGGAFTLIESHTKGGAPPHVHSREDEAMYVLQGSIVATCAGETLEVGPGSFVFLHGASRTHGT